MVDRRLPNTDVTEAFITYVRLDEEWNNTEGEFGKSTTDNVSTTQRPGGLSSDYLTEFEMGPVALSSSGDGLLQNVWKVELQGREFWIFRETDEKDGWQEGEFLFDIGEEISSGISTPTQFSFSFDQNGRPVVSFDANGSCYLWWFDPQEGDQVIRNLGPGRTPVVLLDEKRPQFLGDGNDDILVYYIDENDDLVYLQQRDRYNEKYPTPLTNTPTGRCERLYRTTDQRVSCIVSEFDESADRYSFVYVTSWPYKIYSESPGTLAELLFDDFSVRQIIIRREEHVPTSLSDLQLDSFNIRLVVMRESVDQSRTSLSELLFDDVTLRAVILRYTEEDSQASLSELLFDDVTFRVKILRYTEEDSQASLSDLKFDSFTLEVV